jgi:hypothetical protein
MMNKNAFDERLTPAGMPALPGGRGELARKSREKDRDAAIKLGIPEVSPFHFGA